MSSQAKISSFFQRGYTKPSTQAKLDKNNDQPTISVKSSDISVSTTATKRPADDHDKNTEDEIEVSHNCLWQHLTAFSVSS